MAADPCLDYVSSRSDGSWHVGRQQRISSIWVHKRERWVKCARSTRWMNVNKNIISPPSVFSWFTMCRVDFVFVCTILPPSMSPEQKEPPAKRHLMPCCLLYFISHKYVPVTFMIDMRHARDTRLYEYGVFQFNCVDIVSLVKGVKTLIKIVKDIRVGWHNTWCEWVKLLLFLNFKTSSVTVASKVQQLDNLWNLKI